MSSSPTSQDMPQATGTQTTLSVINCPPMICQKAAQYKISHTLPPLKPTNPFKNRRTPQSASIINLLSPVYNNYRTAQQTAVAMHKTALGRVLQRRVMETTIMKSPQQIAPGGVHRANSPNPGLSSRQDPMFHQMVRPLSPLGHITIAIQPWAITAGFQMQLGRSAMIFAI